MSCRRSGGSASRSARARHERESRRTFAEMILTATSKHPDASSAAAQHCGGAAWKTVLSACRTTLSDSSARPSMNVRIAEKKSVAYSCARGETQRQSRAK